MTPAGHDHGGIAGAIFGELYMWTRKHRLGKLYAAETGFVIGRAPDTLRAPDVAFVAAERVPASGAGFFEGHPDLAVEVVSPGDRESDIDEKVQMWLDAGTQEVWVAWPRTRSMTVHRPGAEVVLLHGGDTLEAGPVLPGFTLAVSQVFE